MTQTDAVNSQVGKTSFDFSALKNAEQTQTARDLTAYQELLRSIARGECKLSQDTILAIIRNADADAAQLEADVRWRKERDEKIAALRQMPEDEAKKTALEQKVQKMREAFQKKEEEHNAQCRPIWHEISQLEQRIRAASSYKSNLEQSCRDIRLKLEYQTLDNQWDNRITVNVYDRHRRVYDAIADAQRRYEKACKTITIDREEVRRSLKEEIKSLEQESEALEAKKAELAKKKAEHEKALAALREKMIFS